MAKVSGTVNFTGTIGNLTFYQLNGKHYVRTKSSLNKKRFYKDPAFARSRVRALQFGIAVRLATQVYRKMAGIEKKQCTIGKITGIANRLLQEGKTKEQVLHQLKAQFLITVLKLPVHQHCLKGALSLSRWTVNKKGRLLSYPVQVAFTPFAFWAKPVRDKTTDCYSKVLVEKLTPV